MATLYFNGSNNSNWNTIYNNWWLDSAFTVPATSLPTTGDTVYIEGIVGTQPSVPVALATLYIAQINEASEYSGSGSNLSVTGDLIVGVEGNLRGYVNFATMTVGRTAIFLSGGTTDCILNVGYAAFYETASLSYTSTINGNVEFNDTSSCAAGSIINGNALFNNNSSNNGTVNGSATFNNNSVCNNVVNGNCVFNDNSHNGGRITGNVTFNDNSENNYGITVTGNAVFNGHAFNLGVITENAVFNGYSSNSPGAVVEGNAVFNNHTFNSGSIRGSATANYPVGRPLGGGVSGTIFYYGYPYFYFNATDGNWNNLANWKRDSNLSVSATSLPQNGDTVSIESNLTTGPTTAVTLSTLYVAQIMTGATFSSLGTGGITLTGDLVVGSGIYTYGIVEGFNLTVGGTARFYGNGTKNGATLMVGTAYFYLGASNYGAGAVVGNAVFRDNANNSNSVSLNGMFSDKSFNAASSIARNATFIDSSSNASGGVVATNVGTNATFKNAAVNVGSVTENALVYYPATRPLGGSVGGTITYFNYPP